MIQASGLTTDNITHGVTILQHDITASRSYRRVAKLVDNLVYLIAIEMDSIGKDIHYWTGLLHSHPWSRKLIRNYYNTYQYFREICDINHYYEILMRNGSHAESLLSIVEDNKHNARATECVDNMDKLDIDNSHVNSNNNGSQYDNSNSNGNVLNYDITQNDIELILFQLRLKFISLSRMMAKVHHASCLLKLVYMDIVNCAVQYDTIRNDQSVTISPIDSEKKEKVVSSTAMQQGLQLSAFHKQCSSIARTGIIAALTCILELFPNEAKDFNDAIASAGKSSASDDCNVTPLDTQDENKKAPCQRSDAPQPRKMSIENLTALMPSPKKLSTAIRDRTNSLLEIGKSLLGDNEDDSDVESVSSQGHDRSMATSVEENVHDMGAEESGADLDEKPEHIDIVDYHPSFAFTYERYHDHAAKQVSENCHADSFSLKLPEETDTVGAGKDSEKPFIDTFDGMEETEAQQNPRSVPQPVLIPPLSPVRSPTRSPTRSPSAKLAVRARSRESKYLLGLLRKVSSIISKRQYAPDPRYPLQSTRSNTHRPTLAEQMWLPNTVGLVIGAYLSRKAYIMYETGVLKVLWDRFQAWFVLNIREHMLEPMTDLVNELFDTMSRKKDAVVTREELHQSKIALQRMLDNFSKSLKGTSLLTKIMNEYGPQLSLSANDSSGGSNQVSNGDNTGTASAVPSVSQSSQAGVSQGTSHPGAQPPSQFQRNAMLDNPSQEMIMEALMRSYENEMQNPFQGLLFGNLMTSMLIQMQKLKVHTEAALLTMDQVLASNQLTMACTAALPSIALIAVVGYRLYRLFRPPATKPGIATLELRLVMSDVERSLAEVYCQPSTDRRVDLQSTRRQSANSVRQPSQKSQLHKLDGGSNHDSQLGINRISVDESEYGVFAPNLHESMENFTASTILDARRGLVIDHSRNSHGSNAPFPDQVPILSPQAHDSVGIRPTGRGTTDQQLIARGKLCYHLTRLRIALDKLFLTNYWSRTDDDGTSAATVSNSWFISKYFTSGFSALLGSAPSLEIHSVSEYVSISRDLADLSSPDEEVSPQRKLQTAARMRISYQCLVSPAR